MATDKHKEEITKEALVKYFLTNLYVKLYTIY